MIILGLTGSIGMGKSVTAHLFTQENVPVHDSDAAVHRLYAGEAEVVSAIERLCPEAIVKGRVDRGRLADMVGERPELLKNLEAVVHPFVRWDADQFVRKHRDRGSPLIVLEIPLLFESGNTDRVDKILVVTAPPEIQRQRVLARFGMTEEKFKWISVRQMSNEEKCQRADFVIETHKGMQATQDAVRSIIDKLTRSCFHNSVPYG